MAELIDTVELAPMQSVDLHENGEVWLHDNKAQTDIKLDAQATTLLYDFLLSNMQAIEHHAKVIRYNRQMDERNKLIRESVEKPWLPLHDGE